MKKEELLDAIDAIWFELDAFENEHSNGQINLKNFLKFEEIYDAAKYLWLTGLLKGIELRSDTTPQVGELYDKAVPLRKHFITSLSMKELEAEAENGDTEAAYLLVYKFEESLGVSQDWKLKNKEKLFEWGEIAIQDAQEKGMSWIKWSLANHYIEDENFEKAVQLLSEASDEGETQAAYMLGCLYFEGDIEPDGTLAKHYLEIAASDNDERAQIELARLYLAGELIEEDLRQTFELARKAKLSGSDEGKELLANCFEYGWGTRQNRPKAYRLYQELGADYPSEMRMQIADDYLEGISVEKDVERGLQILHEAAEDGDVIALSSLATKYFYGFDVDENEELAFEYALRAANSEEPPARALLHVGKSYVLGQGTEINHEKAVYWLNLAKEHAVTDDQRAEAEVWLEDELGVVVLEQE